MDSVNLGWNVCCDTKFGIKINQQGNFDPYWQRHRPHFPQINVPEEIAPENLIDGGNLPAGVVENEV
jgi:hypothetical protein